VEFSFATLDALFIVIHSKDAVRDNRCGLYNPDLTKCSVESPGDFDVVHDGLICYVLG
jgi:hypothetical protein